jgi:hypothetical protein
MVVGAVIVDTSCGLEGGDGDDRDRGARAVGVLERVGFVLGERPGLAVGLDARLVELVAVGDQDLLDAALVERGDLARGRRIGGLGRGDRPARQSAMSMNSAPIAAARFGARSPGR